MSSPRILKAPAVSAVPYRAAGPRPADPSPPAPPADHDCQVFEKGYAAGRDEAERELRRHVELAQALLRQARGTCARVVADTQPLVVQLALSIAEKVLRQEIRRQRRWLVALIEDALRHVGEASSVTVALNPDDHRAVVALWPQADGPAVAFVADPAIAPAGCRIDTNLGSLDAGLETQLETIGQSLRALAQDQPSLEAQAWGLDPAD